MDVPIPVRKTMWATVLDYAKKLFLESPDYLFVRCFRDDGEQLIVNNYEQARQFYNHEEIREIPKCKKYHYNEDK